MHDQGSLVQIMIIAEYNILSVYCSRCLCTAVDTNIGRSFSTFFKTNEIKLMKIDVCINMKEKYKLNSFKVTNNTEMIG